MRQVFLGLLLLGCERAPELLAESDQHALVPIEVADISLDEDGVLWRRAGGISTKLLDRASGVPAILADRSVVVSRRGDAPGETDLWIVPSRGEARALAPADGADDMPVAMPDGKIAFVSTRTTIASIWILDPASGSASQLTNRGLIAGRKREGFVPPPMQRMSAAGSELHYESAPGVWWAVDASSGAARRLEEAR
jgi:Tol biopolymer transport system component